MPPLVLPPDAPRPDEATLPADEIPQTLRDPAASQEAARRLLTLAFPDGAMVLPADTTQFGSFLTPRLFAGNDPKIEIPVLLSLHDLAGRKLDEAEFLTTEPVHLDLPDEGIWFVVRAEVKRPGLADFTGYHGLCRGDWAEQFEQLRAQAQTLLDETTAHPPAWARSNADRARLRSYLLFARKGMGADAPPPSGPQIYEAIVVKRTLDTIAAGQDPLLAAPGPSLLAWIDLPGDPETRRDRMRFWVHRPDPFPADRKWPLAFFLHGSTKATRMEDGARGGLMAFPDGQEMGFLSIVPKCDTPGSNWDPALLDQLLDHLVAAYPVDADRVSATGHSRGASWLGPWIERSGDRIAAIAPAAFAFAPLAATAPRLKDFPIWIIQGEGDNPGNALVVNRWLRLAGGSPRLTLQPGGNHMSVFQEFHDPKLWRWMTGHARRPLSGASFVGADGFSAVEVLEQPAGGLLGTAIPDPLTDEPERARALQALLEQARSGVPWESPDLVPALTAVAPAASGGEWFGGLWFREKPAAAPAALTWRPGPAQRFARVLHRGAPGDVTVAMKQARTRIGETGHRITGPAEVLLWGGSYAGQVFREFRFPLG